MAKQRSGKGESKCFPLVSLSPSNMGTMGAILSTHQALAAEVRTHSLHSTQWVPRDNLAQHDGAHFLVVIVME